MLCLLRCLFLVLRRIVLLVILLLIVLLRSLLFLCMLRLSIMFLIRRMLIRNLIIIFVMRRLRLRIRLRNCVHTISLLLRRRLFLHRLRRVLRLFLLMALDHPLLLKHLKFLSHHQNILSSYK